MTPTAYLRRSDRTAGRVAPIDWPSDALHNPPTSAPIPATEMNPLVFVGSSSEGEAYASAVKAQLERGGKITARHWQDVIDRAPSKTTIEALAEALDEYDFGVFVLSKVDLLTIRGEQTAAPRDNVVLEVGLFTGRLGRGRTFIIAPDDFDIRVATDLLGVVIGTYTNDTNKQSAVRTAVTPLRDRILEVGPKTTVSVSGSVMSDAERSSGLPNLMPPTDGWVVAARDDRLVSASETDLRPGTWLVAESTGVVQVSEVLPPVLGREVVVGVRVPGDGRSYYFSESALYRTEFR